jgi:hypothetical protein
MLVFTDEGGAVVLIEDDLARLLGFADPDEGVGDPLAAVLGLEPGEAAALLEDIALSAPIRNRLVQVRSRQTGRTWWALLHGTATVGEGRFLGADITVTPLLPTDLVDDSDHRTRLEQMAQIARLRTRNGAEPAISSEKEFELRSYFAARMLAIYVLVTRMGGRAVGQMLEEKIRRRCLEQAWSMDMKRGRFEFGAAGFDPEACREIMRVTQEYAVRVTSKRLVRRELAELDVNFSRLTVQRATRFGLRLDP